MRPSRLDQAVVENRGEIERTFQYDAIGLHRNEEVVQFDDRGEDAFIAHRSRKVEQHYIVSFFSDGGPFPPFRHRLGRFAAGRAFEQVRNSIGYPHLNVKIGATHAGISVGEDGATHQCNEDIALMRMIPGMVVINPCDDVEAKAAVRAAYEYEGPVYLRFGRLAVPVINDEATYKFELGKGVVLKEGKDVTIIATGLCVNEAVEAAKLLAADGIDAEVINIHTIKPLDEDLVIASAQKTGKVVTVEEHSVIGGLGSAVCDALSEKAPTKVMKIGVYDRFGESGPGADLIKKYELDAESIYKKVKGFLS